MATPRSYPGSRFYAADLHTHTPASHDYNDKTIAPKDWVNAALAAGLDVVAVTDHNSAEWVDSVRDAAKGTNLIVFPGVEVSTPHCHVLAIFDPTTKKHVLDDFLTTVGITTANRGKKEVNSHDLEKVLAEIENFGGLAIAAHANSSNGLLKSGTGQFRLKMCKDKRLCGLEFSQRPHVEGFTAGAISGYPSKACFQGSDAHSLAELGARRVFLRMDKPSVWSLQQTTRDHLVRIRHEWNRPEDVYASILGLSVNQGFFKDAEFKFHPSLNCLVGGRGTGKSTAIELLRFAFDDASSIEDISSDSEGKLEALLGLGGRVTVRYLDGDGVVKLIQRELSDRPTNRMVTTEQGVGAEIIVPPTFFSQGELTRIAQDRMAQLDLIDRYIDVAEEETREPQIVSKLRANAMELQQFLTQAEAGKGELEDKDKGLTASRQRVKDLEKTLKDPVLKEYSLWESEERYFSEAEEALDALLEDIQEAVGGLDPESLVELPDERMPNKRLLNGVQDAFTAIAEKISKAKTEVVKEVESKKKELAKARKQWEPLFEKKKAAFTKALDKAGATDVGKASTHLRSFRKHLEVLERTQRAQGVAAKKIEALWLERSKLLDELDRLRTSRYAKRASKAKAWESEFKGRITVALEELADKSHYAAALRELARGAVLRDPDIQALVANVPPRKLTELVLKGDAATIASSANIRVENAQKLLEIAKGRETSRLLDIEVVDMADAPDIQYEARPGTIKGLRQLSTGQRATVIISLGLIEGNAPLVIDQPEEPLDTLAITSPVVDTLRAQKDKRQFIFTTHNANVAVGGDAELNIVLDANSDLGRIHSAGGVDDPNTNELLVLHLEGGKDAIDRRFAKYRL